MHREETAVGFFTKMKSVFSYTEKTGFDEANGNFPDLPETNENDSEVSSAPLSFASRFHGENITEKEVTLRTVAVTAPTYKIPVEKDLDIRFATKFIAAGGKFVFCESLQAAIENVRMLKEENKWSHVFCWENEIKDAFGDYNFQKGQIGYTIENSDAAISLCENLVADEGTIILNPKQASRRRLHCFPKTHIIITDIAHITRSEAEALEKFSTHNKGELPSIIKLGSCNKGHFYDKHRLILNSEGTEDVYVFLVDEIIPPSLRP